MSPRTFRRRRQILALGGIVVAALLLAACSAKNSSGGTGGLVGAQPGTSVSVTSGSTTTLAPSTGSTATATSTSTPTSATTSKTSGSGGGAKGVHIVTFRVTQKPACPVVPSSDAPFAHAAVDIILEWNVTGATKVALSLDDPGFFKTYHTGSISDYPTKHSVDLSFQCDPTVQPNTTHKYTLDTIGGGATVERTLTVTVQTSP